MTGLGTDVLALTCILFGAATGGGLTLALLDAQEPEANTCAARALPAVPGLVVRGSSHGHTVFMTRPGLAFESADCEALVQSVVTVGVDEIRRSVERVRVDVERARAELEEARARGQESRTGEGEAMIQEIQVRLEAMDVVGTGGSY